MLKVLGLVRSKFWSRKILGIDAGGGGDLAFNLDDEECLFDSGDGDGVVSRDETDDVDEREVLRVSAPVALCLT